MTEGEPSGERWRLDARTTAVALFGLTVASVYWVGRRDWASELWVSRAAPFAELVDVGQARWDSGVWLALSLMTILVAHEAGHYVAARLHGESPTLPFFLPLPWANPFGTLGAVLFLDDRTRSRNALLDIGAAGPLAGLVAAIPLMAYGLSLSPVLPLATTGYTQEGQSLLYWALKRAVLGPIPAGHDVIIHPIVAAAWAGFYVTFLNLAPFGQLDGGHVGSALFGARQRWVARVVRLVPATLLVYNAVVFAGPALGGAWGTLATALLPWLALQILLLVMERLTGLEPTATTAAPLAPWRKAVGWLTLSFYVLLFVPSPWVTYP